MITNKLIATFADGTSVIRNSKREYTHGWRITWPHPTYLKNIFITGFASSEDKARKNLSAWPGGTIEIVTVAMGKQ